MEAKDKIRKWKDALLKTSLPLELLVAEILHRNEIYVSGEYDYLRANEHGESAEFSVDLSAFRIFESNQKISLALNFLIECKYNYPGVKWIFAPYANDEAVVTGILSTFQDFCTRRIDTASLYLLDDSLPYSFKGIELHADSANPNTIERGINQLRYAIPQKVSRILSNQVTCRHDEDLSIDVLCPILLTTSELFIIKPGLALETFQNANELEEIAKKVDCLVYYQSIGANSHLWEYNKELSRQLEKEHPEIRTHLKAYAKALTEQGIPRHKISSYFDFVPYFCPPSERILVVSFNVFEKVLKQVIDLVEEANKSVKQVAELDSIREKSVSPNETLKKLLNEYIVSAKGATNKQQNIDQESNSEVSEES